MPHRHRAEPSEMVVVDGAPRFMAVCSCGWKSEPVRPNRVLIEWEDHVDAIRRDAAATHDAARS